MSDTESTEEVEVQGGDEAVESKAGIESLMQEEAEALLSTDAGDPSPAAAEAPPADAESDATVEPVDDSAPGIADDASAFNWHNREPGADPASGAVQHVDAGAAADAVEDAGVEPIADTDREIEAVDAGVVDGDPDAESAVDGRDDLNARAAKAAKVVVGEADNEDLEDVDEVLRLAESTTSNEQRRVRKRQDKILAGLLVANLCLMGFMIAVPGKDSSGQHVPPGVGPNSGTTGAESNVPAGKAPNPFHAALQEPNEVLPNHEMFDAGLAQIGKGDHARAINLFERYLSAHPDLRPVQLQMVYNSLAMCLEQVGRKQDARAYQAKSDNLRQITALPDELWEAAQRAEADGRGADMRRYYARFLLQQDQLGKRWISQGKIAEAYMKIGDSYRIDAEKGARLEEAAAKAEKAAAKASGKKGGH